MNEATVLSKVGEGAGYAVGSGVRAARRGSMWVSRSGATAGLGAARMAAQSARARAAKRAAGRLETAGAAAYALARRPAAPSPAAAPPTVNGVEVAQ